MDSLTAAQRKVILARVSIFPYCGFGTYITGNMCYYKSFVGRDFMSWMLMAIFIVTSYLSESQTRRWYLYLRYAIVLSSFLIFCVVCCLPLSAEKIDECRYLCKEFVKPTAQIMCQYSNQFKTHLLR